MNIGLIGYGFVGKATRLLESKSIKFIIYDINPEYCVPLGTQLDDLELCDLIFICLPTPINHDGSCYVDHITNIVNKINNPFKIIRSTVPIGFSQTNNCYFMPEFLTEAKWKDDFINTKYWIFGLLNDNIIFKNKISKLFTTSKEEGSIISDEIYWVSNSEAEFIKLSKNCFLAAKVGIMNELYALAKVKNINYDTCKNILQLDNRIGKTHMDVPGINNIFGYGGTCFPKDTYNLYNQYQNENIPSYYFQTSLIRNETVDRPNRDWLTNYGRSTILTNNKISLVLSGNKLSDYICNKLLDMDHIVICIGDNNIIHPNYINKKANIINKQFFPKLDYICDLRNLDNIQDYLLGTFNILDLIKVHNCNLLSINYDDLINKLYTDFSKTILISSDIDTFELDFVINDLL
jgi:UDPglucose 6-dehydrogenase